jgi:alpha-L-rhamnosidase
MSPHGYTRRWFTPFVFSAPLWRAAVAEGQTPRDVSIADFGAVGDDAKVNTKAIQAAIDHAAGSGGGTVTVPRGVFVSGALFLKPKVNLHLEKDAVLKCSTDMANFPVQRTRIEGHFEEKFNPALINAKNCDGLRISGEGTLDGAGRPIWDLFWKLRAAAPNPGNFPNVGVPRARMALIESSRGVTIEGITFKDSQFWNLHLYRCQDVTVRQARFEVPDDYRQAPSTDGVDLDSCQDVTVDGCYFSVTDDCIAAKGSKGPHAAEDKDSPPVERIRVRNITLDSAGGTIVSVRPWSQYVDLKGEAPPNSVVRNLSMVGIQGRFGAFGAVQPNPGQTEISDVSFKDFDVTLDKDQLATSGVSRLSFENVKVNGKLMSQ